MYESHEVFEDDEWRMHGKTPVQGQGILLSIPGTAGEFYGESGPDGLITWPFGLSDEQREAATVSSASGAQICAPESWELGGRSCVVTETLSNEQAYDTEGRALSKTLEQVYTDPCKPRALAGTEISFEGVVDCEDVTAVMSTAGGPQWNCYMKREVRCAEPPITGPKGALNFAFFYGDDLDDIQRQIKEAVDDCRLVAQHTNDARGRGSSFGGIVWACDPAPSTVRPGSDFYW